MSDSQHHNKYIKNAQIVIQAQFEGLGTVEWESPSNIALIKYWGKYGNQLPRNPSLSFTLKHSKTRTKIVYQKTKNKSLQLEYYFDDERNRLFEKRVYDYLLKVTEYLPFLNKLDLMIYSNNTFPHSSGIASSASSFGALASGLCSIEHELFGTLNSKKGFYRKASFLARLGSGSACRSVIPASVVLWGNTEDIKDSSDEISISLDRKIHPVFRSYYNAILIIDSVRKSLSSSEGHKLMQDHPFAESRYKQARINLEKLIPALRSGDEHEFAKIVENEALTLHALMLSSSVAVRLIKPNSLLVISKLIEFRNETKLNFTFTLDAGPNIHILYPERNRTQMVNFINSELKTYCRNGAWIDDEISDGPKQIE